MQEKLEKKETIIMQQHIPTSNKKKFYCNMIIKEETNLPVVVGNALHSGGF